MFFSHDKLIAMQRRLTFITDAQWHMSRTSQLL